MIVDTLLILYNKLLIGPLWSAGIVRNVLGAKRHPITISIKTYRVRAPANSKVYRNTCTEAGSATQDNSFPYDYSGCFWPQHQRGRASILWYSKTNKKGILLVYYPKLLAKPLGLMTMRSSLPSSKGYIYVWHHIIAGLTLRCLHNISTT